jgi:small redox-active disulfide protein 2
MEIKVLGTGCPRCQALEKAVINSLAEMDLAAYVCKVDDMMEIMKYGIVQTPGLVINDKVVLSGRVPSSSEIKKLISQNLER